MSVKLDFINTSRLIKNKPNVYANCIYNATITNNKIVKLITNKQSLYWLK